MGRFILENDYHFLSFHDIYEKAASSSLPSLFDCVAVLEMYQVSNGIFMFRDYNYTAHFHPQKTHGYAFGNDIKVQNELEIYGVVIRGEKLQTLIEELKNASKCLNVNRQGLCLMGVGTVWHNIGAYYPVYELFDWRKYGVNVQVTGVELLNGEAGVKEEFYQKEDELKDLGLELEKTKKEFYHVEKELKDLSLELEKTKKELYQKEKERKDLSLELEKTKKEFFQKEKERKYLESHLQEKEKDLRLCEKQLDEKDQESKKLTKRLHVVQNEVIIGSIYREYCSNDSFEKRLQNLSAVSRETHVVLAFARDYDDWDSHTNGIFKVFFDQNMTPLMIANFKRDSPTAKFFLCIGDRSQRYPFDVTDKHTWIINATTSLKCIIQEYGFHGIDVYYTRSNTNADDFIYAIGTVIDTLMTQQIITTASIAPCSFMHGPDCKFYAGLYNRNPMNFDFVVFQTHDDDNDIPMNDAQQLINIFNKLASDDNFPKEKLVAGHSILPKDWDTLPYPVILTALPQLIKSGVVQGTSVWTLTDDQP
ncbi:ruBisCO-associated protein-like [Senna tora]|uniref:RuBisCO-associated protein-like n=1 Tax=Senna tora TaxID=362788 RepID=A0A834XH82_9FABA|nr:ruBisCO-associated protein-like [Senna tora]